VLREQSTLSALALVGDQLWATSAGALLYLPPEGPSVPLLAGLQNPHALAVDGDALIFATDPKCPSGACPSQPILWRVSLVDRIPVPLLQVQEGIIFDIAVADSWIYFTGDIPGANGRLHRVRRDGSDHEDLSFATTRVVADRAADQVFVSDGRDLVRLDAESGTSTVIARLFDEGPVDAMALDPTHLYVAMQNGALQRAPRHGGPLEDVHAGPAFITGIAIDQRAVYALVCGTGVVMMTR
jgi:hypothetical protein